LISKSSWDNGVIAFTLTFVDEGAEDGVKTYRLREDGNIDIDYTFSINEEPRKSPTNRNRST